MGGTPLPLFPNRGHFRKNTLDQMKNSQKRKLHGDLNFLNIEEKKINKRITAGVHCTLPQSTEG